MTRFWKQATLTGCAVVAASLALAACGGNSGNSGDSNGPIAGQTITLYSGQHEQTTQALVKAFEAKTGVDVKIRTDDEDVLAQQIEQEGSRSPADVFFTENTPPLARLDEKGLLSPIDAGALAKVPPQYSASDKNWAGVSSRYSMIVYNTDDLTPAELPKSIFDLADPKWKDKLDISPGETDFAPIVTSIAQDKGDAAAVSWLEAIKSNAGAHQDPDNETLVANVNNGVTELGVINHYYWYRLKQEVGESGLHSALAPFAAGDDGSLLDVSGIGVLKSSQHQKAAQAFVDFVLSAEGQKVLVDSDSWEYPLGDGVTNPALPPVSTYTPRDFDLSEIGDGTKAVTLLQQAGLL